MKEKKEQQEEKTPRQQQNELRRRGVENRVRDKDGSVITEYDKEGKLIPQHQDWKEGVSKESIEEYTITNKYLVKIQDNVRQATIQECIESAPKIEHEGIMADKHESFYGTGVAHVQGYKDGISDYKQALKDKL